MVERNPDRLSLVFHGLADPTRRAMLRRLAQGPLTVGELAEPFPISLAAVSKHLKSLERAGLIRREVRGREHHCRLDPAVLEDAWSWIAFYEGFWNERLDALETLLDERRDPDEESHAD